VRKTIQWLLLIVAVLASLGGGYVYWRWSTANEQLLQTIREELAERAPGWNITVASARFDWHRRVHLHNITVKDKDGKTVIARIPEVVLVLDRQKLADAQTVDVQRVRIIRPELHLTRDSQGTWNWQKLPPLKKSERKSPLPDVVIDQATVHVRLEHAGNMPPAEVLLRKATLNLIPRSERQFHVEGTTTIRDAGKLTMTGRWHLDRKVWSVNGRMQNVEASGELLGLAVGTSPELRRNVARLEAALRRMTPKAERPKTTVDADALPNFGAAATVDLAFHLEQRTPGEELQFDLHAKFRQGRINNPVLPTSLNALQADLHWSNDFVEIRNASARSGPLHVQADIEIRRRGTATPCRLKFHVRNLPLNDRLETRLPESWRKVYRTIHPRGQIDVAGILEYDGEGKWTPHNCVLTTRDCSFAHSEFPYRFTHVNGTLTQDEQDEDRYTLNFTGRAGRQQATLTGWVRNPGPTATARYDLTVKGFQFDDDFLAACQPSVRKTMKSLGAAGSADVHFTAIDSGEIGTKPRLYLTADLKNCAIEYDNFPYRLSRLSGRIVYDSKTDVWTFSKLKARNGPATFTGRGLLSETKGKSHLELTVTGEGAYFDKPLYRALPKPLQQLWNDLSPQGIVDLTVDLDWTEDKPLLVAIPKCRVSKGTMTVRSFPYRFDEVAARFAYLEGTLRILSFAAKHNDTQIRAEGFAETHPSGEWRLRLVKFLADDLIPDRDFRRALNADLRNVVEELDPEGPVSVSGMLEFRGTGNEKDPVTAAWDVKLILTGNSLNFGVALKDVHGRVFVRGTWDGRTVDMRKGNRFDLDSISVRGYQLTNVRGPFQLYDKQLLIGSAEPFKPQRPREKPRKIPLKERITASAIGGRFTLDGYALFRKQTEYRLLFTLHQGRLEKFAQRYLKGKKNLKGIIYGRVELQGKGKSPRNLIGRGKVLISPAALYELPVFVQIFKVLNPVPVDKTAFRVAYADFEIADRQFLFKTIDLQGDAINLRGRGVAGFDGKLAIDFYSMLPRSRLPVVILRQLVKSATAGWVGVQVRGTVSRPIARIRAIPKVDDALQRFLGAISGRPPATLLPPPRRNTMRRN